MSRPVRLAGRFACLMVFIIISMSSGPAGAFCFCCDSNCGGRFTAASVQWRSRIRSEHDNTRKHFTREMQNHQQWFVRDYFKGYILPAMMRATEQLSAVGLQQVFVLGTFLDAKQQLETQRLFQEMAAQAQKDYHPSEGLCTIGSNLRSLAKSDRNSDLTMMVMAQRSLDRQLLNANANSSAGPSSDRAGRLAQFRKTYCDKNDNNQGLSVVCSTGPAPPQARLNKDVDFARTVGLPLTLDINFSDSTVTPDEEDVLALSSNLYSHRVLPFIEKAKLKDNPANQQIYMDMRSIVAKRSVAEQSFQAITAMKSRGATNSAETAKYLRGALRELGVPSDAEADAILGTDPSYYAQMEVLTKKIFQRPQFFSDLYDKPANVARKGVAIQAIALMQSEDMYKYDLRTEALLAVLLELQVIKAQDTLQGQAHGLTGD
jgi:hypothetical protein